MNTNHKCPYCGASIRPGQAVCPNCGSPVPDEIYDNIKEDTDSASRLEPGTILHKRYKINGYIGSGGFGITYDGTDTVLDAHIAIKEYFPREIACRQTKTTHDVSTRANSDEKSFKKGMGQFLHEAKTLAMFSGEDGFIHVNDFFDENKTAYIVMEFVNGMTIDQYMEKHGTFTFESCLKTMLPVMKALDKVHAKGLIHRDVSPSNIMILDDGRVKLLDFGAARQPNADRHTVSVIIRPGYSPVEQFASNSPQGPYTDIYALCATMYKMLTGNAPENSIDRLSSSKKLAPPSSLGVKITPRQEQTLLKGLEVQPENRIQTIRGLMQGFGIEVGVKPAARNDRNNSENRNIRGAQANSGPYKNNTGSPDTQYTHSRTGGYDIRKQKGVKRKAGKKKRHALPKVIITVLAAAAVVIAAYSLKTKLLNNAGTDTSQSQEDASDSVQTTARKGIEGTKYLKKISAITDDDWAEIGAYCDDKRRSLYDNMGNCPIIYQGDSLKNSWERIRDYYSVENITFQKAYFRYTKDIDNDSVQGNYLTNQINGSGYDNVLIISYSLDLDSNETWLSDYNGVYGAFVLENLSRDDDGNINIQSCEYTGLVDGYTEIETDLVGAYDGTYKTAQTKDLTGMGW